MLDKRNLHTILLRNQQQMPILGVDTSFLKREHTKELLGEAISKNYVNIDVSQIQDNIAEVGDILKSFKRDDFFVTCKIWISNYKNFVLKSIRRTLNALHLSYFDLVLLHFPYEYDDEINVHCFMWLKRLREEGLIRSIGVANFSLKQLQRLHAQVGLYPDVNQVYINLRNQKTRLRKYMAKRRIVCTAYFEHRNNPLLVFNSRTISRSSLLRINKTVDVIATKNNCIRKQIFFRWAIQEGMTILTNPIDKNEVEIYLDLFTIRLTPFQMQRLRKLKRKENTLGIGFVESEKVYVLNVNFLEGFK